MKMGRLIVMCDCHRAYWRESMDHWFNGRYAKLKFTCRQCNNIRTNNFTHTFKLR